MEQDGTIDNMNEITTLQTFGAHQPAHTDGSTSTEESRDQVLIETSTAKESTIGEEVERKQGRKRKKNEENWKQNQAKRLRNAEKEYKTKND